MEESGGEPHFLSLCPRAGPEVLKAAHVPHGRGCGLLGPSVEYIGSGVSESRSAPASLSVPDPQPAGSSVSGASGPVGHLGLSLLELGAEVLVRAQDYLMSI